MAAFMDSGWRVANGQRIYTDFYYMAEPVHPVHARAVLFRSSASIRSPCSSTCSRPTRSCSAPCTRRRGAGSGRCGVVSRARGQHGSATLVVIRPIATHLFPNRRPTPWCVNHGNAFFRFRRHARLGPTPSPPGVPAGEIWRYGYGFPFQVSATQAAILANIHRKQARTEDFEVGADVVVFDDARQIIPDRAFSISRIHREINPHANEPADMVKQCPVGGFVPHGAKRADGSPHPHAGTGFGVGMAIAYALDEGPDVPYRGCFRGEQSHVYYELLQFAYDDAGFRVTHTDRLRVDELVAGHLFLNCPMRMAIPDGDDLLAAAVVGMPGATVQNIMGDEASGTGVVRWRRGRDGWRIVAFHPVAMDFLNFEPSLVRDADGSLLYTVRPGYAADNRRDLIVWRSSDGGATWSRIIDVKNIHYQSPVTINQAADGSPYLVCNHYLSALMSYEDSFTDGFGRITSREMLCLWPLNALRDGLLSPHVVCFPRYEYGPPPVAGDRADPATADVGGTNRGRDWTCDHPSGATVRLADGRWHSLLCFRLLAQAEVQGGIPPTPHSGLCVEEVTSGGSEVGEWRF